MQITGMLHGAGLLEFVGFPATEVLGPGASEERQGLGGSAIAGRTASLGTVPRMRCNNSPLAVDGGTGSNGICRSIWTSRRCQARQVGH